jgi:hypothetical protein
MLNGIGKRITKLHIEAESDSVVQLVLDGISRYDSFDLRFLEIRVFNPLEPHTSDPPSLPKGSKPKQLRLHGTRPHWTVPDVYGSLTKIVLVDLWEDVDLQWPQLHSVLHASVNLTELFLVDVMCAGYMGGAPVILPSLKTLGLKYSNENCVPFLGNVQLTSLDTLELYSRGDATLDPILAHTRHICTAADTVYVKVELEDPNTLKQLFPLFTNASTIDARGCGITGLIVFTLLVVEQALALPQLLDLKLGSLIHKAQAEIILGGGFAKGLKLRGGLGADGGLLHVDSALGRWDCFEWVMDEVGVVTRIITRGKAENRFRF